MHHFWAMANIYGYRLFLHPKRFFRKRSWVILGGLFEGFYFFNLKFWFYIRLPRL
ncbi:MAG: hypothetical protein CM15mP102_13460 [Flavobacteriales bacterium]|nr:MAG: hypothetical protein CM15mP102_13460 [Flavobacteriales bacterium]